MLSYDYLDDDTQFSVLLDALDRRGDKSIDRALLQKCREDRQQAQEKTRLIYAAREKKNLLSREFGERMRKKESVVDLKEAIQKVDDEIFDLDRSIQDHSVDYYAFWLTVPNIPSSHVPEGLTEDDNTEVSHFGVKPEFDFKPRDHVELGTRMGCMDFEQTAKISGGRFVTLSGALAKLERCLGNYMVDMAIARGYREVSPPVLVNQQAMEGTGQLPKFEDDLFKAGSHYLIPTAEVSLTNLVRDKIIEIDNTDDRKRILSYVAQTLCFRAEAGSAGRDTRGMMRQHQFSKVEIVVISRSTITNDGFHKSMLTHSQTILQKLDLPHRSMLLCAGELGFSARKTYDIEVWIPSQDRYREIASISNCGDFQARRMNARFRMKGEKPDFVHTLNGSALAIGRTIIAIMENNQSADGSVSIPKVLRDAMGGSIITPDGTVF